jgi:hypothetical protein
MLRAGDNTMHTGSRAGGGAETAPHATPSHADTCADCQQLREVLRDVIMAWDSIYRDLPATDNHVAEDIEFGPLNKARELYDPNWFKNEAFESVSDERRLFESERNGEME